MMFTTVFTMAPYIHYAMHRCSTYSISIYIYITITKDTVMDDSSIYISTIKENEANI